MAFAGPDLEAEFLSYKESAITDELGFDEKRKKILSEGIYYKSGHIFLHLLLFLFSTF